MALVISDDTTIRDYERAYGPFVHMSKEEQAIWLRFLIQGGTRFAPFAYDVRVGDGLIMPPGSSSFAINAAAALTTKRIDVLFFENDVAVITEVKRRAGLGAIGQLIGYRDLYLKTPGVTHPAAMLLVTDELQPDMEALLETNGIRWSTVGL